MKMKFKTLIILIIVSGVSGCGLSEKDTVERDSFIGRGLYYYDNGKYINAYQQFTLALQIDPKNKIANDARGWSLYFLGNIQTAEEQFEKSLDMDAYDFQALYGMGCVQFKKAINLQKYINQLKDEVKANKNKGKSIEKETQQIEGQKPKIAEYLEKCLTYLKKAYNRQEESYYILQQIGYVYVYKGIEFYPQAEENLKKYLDGLEKEKIALETLKAKAAKHQIDAGVDAVRREEWEVEEKRLNQLAEKNDKDKSITYLFLGAMYLNLASIEGEGFQKTDSNVHQERLKQYTGKAKDYVKMAIAANQDIPSQYIDMAQIEAMEGNWEKAADQLQIFLKRYPFVDVKIRADAKVREKYLREKAKSESSEDVESNENPIIPKEEVETPELPKEKE